jgi:hypothetical protein
MAGRRECGALGDEVAMAMVSGRRFGAPGDEVGMATAGWWR